jgi:hypothetical protein
LFCDCEQAIDALSAALLISIIAINSDTIGDAFEVLLSLSAIFSGGSITITIGNFFAVSLSIIAIL